MLKHSLDEAVRRRLAKFLNREASPTVLQAMRQALNHLLAKHLGRDRLPAILATTKHSGPGDLDVVLYVKESQASEAASGDSIVIPLPARRPAE